MTAREHEGVAALLAWFGREGVDLPWRRTRDRWAVLVAEAQLQATPVARVLPYFERFMARWPTPEAMAAEPLGNVLAAWHGLGYPRRARNLHAVARAVAEDGWPPVDRLEELPGVGPYTAAAVRCFAGGEDVLPVDTNVRRVLARRFPGGWPGTPDGQGWAAGQALMDLGRLWCTARAPRCDEGCPVGDGCPSAGAGAALAATPPGRRQGRYEGSMRQRRGVLLGALAERGEVPVDRDPEAAASLVADGLAGSRDGLLVPVGA
ncbi:MAG: A/G-specific adenine glycosylase [Miltoncostaeaceae bacterium]|jgi:A/G-specific adenine glycosylase|nr:A/G-specific adenine glycosylase [Miltoncostaeaceae bacterium]